METNIFGSPHGAGCNFVLCDNSVRTINYEIDPFTFCCLCSRNDKQSIDMKKLGE
jgi:hypothetical protein